MLDKPRRRAIDKLVQWTKDRSRGIETFQVIRKPLLKSKNGQEQKRDDSYLFFESALQSEKADTQSKIESRPPSPMNEHVLQRMKDAHDLVQGWRDEEERSAERKRRMIERGPKIDFSHVRKLKKQKMLQLHR